MDVPAEVLQDVVSFVAQTNEVLEKMASQEAEVAKRAPSVVDELVKAGLLDKSQREKAVLTIQDPLKALESLQKTAAVLTKQPVAPASMGKGESIHKTANANAPATSGSMAEADRAFLQRFGLIG